MTRMSILQMATNIFRSGNIFNERSSIVLVKRVIFRISYLAMPFWWCAAMMLKLIVCLCKASFSWNAEDLSSRGKIVLRHYIRQQCIKPPFCCNGFTSIKGHFLHVNISIALSTKIVSPLNYVENRLKPAVMRSWPAVADWYWLNLLSYLGKHHLRFE